MFCKSRNLCDVTYFRNNNELRSNKVSVSQQDTNSGLLGQSPLLDLTHPTDPTHFLALHTTSSYIVIAITFVPKNSIEKPNVDALNDTEKHV